jgi:hypothetical protein
MLNQGSKLLILVVAAFPILAEVQKSGSESKQEVLGMVIIMRGDKPVGFGSDLVVTLTKNGQTYESKTDQKGIFKMQLTPGNYQIKSIYQDSKRLRLYRLQSKSLDIELMPTAMRVDICVLKPK